MGKTKIARVPDISHEEWLELRRTGIGGSDAPTIIGVNPYNSKYALYLDKVGEVRKGSFDNEAMRQGRDLEDYVARRWMEATGKRVQRNNFMWRSEEFPWMLADVDREVIGENAGLECKTTSAFQKADLENGEIPLTYYAQCCHYMATMGYEKMYLSIVVLGKGFYHFEIPRNEEEIAALVEAERQFWNNNILAKMPPEADGSSATENAISARYPSSSAVDIPAELSEKTVSMLTAIEQLDTEIKELQNAKKAAQAAVELEMKECTYGSIGAFSVTWKPQSRTTVDSKKLKSEYPEIWEACSKTTETRVFKFKRNKEE